MMQNTNLQNIVQLSRVILQKIDDKVPLRRQENLDMTVYQHSQLKNLVVVV